MAVNDWVHRRRRRVQKEPDEEVGCSLFLSWRRLWHSYGKGAGARRGGGVGWYVVVGGGGSVVGGDGAKVTCCVGGTLRR